MTDASKQDSTDSTEEDDAFRLRDPMESATVEAYEATIAALVDKAANGESVDEDLAALMEDAPDAVRVEIVKRFREAQEELEGRGESLEVTPEMEAKERDLRAREERQIAHWLSKKTLEKIRKALLSNPALFVQVMSVGDELTKKGVLFDTRKQQISNAELGTVAIQADLAQSAAKDKEKDTGRER